MGYRFDPSRDPYWLAVGGSAAYCQLVPFGCQSAERKSPESAGEETPHRVRRLLLHGGRDVGVGVQGEPGGVVSQHGGEGFDVYPVLQGQDRECVSKLVEAENEGILVEVENRT